MARWDPKQQKVGTGGAAGMAGTLGVQKPSSACTERKKGEEE